jgi:hypothetical protein
MDPEENKRLSWEQLPDEESVHSPTGAVQRRDGGIRKLAKKEKFKYQGGSFVLAN